MARAAHSAVNRIPPSLDPRHDTAMPDYRRHRVPGATYFFTVNLSDRRSDLLVTHIDALRAAVRIVRRRSPFNIDA